jgi:hypothetical protein
VIGMAGMLLAVSLAASPAPSHANGAADLLVEATVSTAGPYGELWMLRLMPDGEVFLRTYYSVNPSGRVMADFDLGEEYAAKLRRTIEEERFFDLPTEISPRESLLHQPDLQLEISLGRRKWKVRLYDPDQLKGNANVKRFLAVWASVYAGIPLKPTW